MTAVQPEHCDEQLDPLGTVERRFAIEIVDCEAATSTAVLSMPAVCAINPFTFMPSLSPLAILVDAAAGRANHIGRTADEWSVSSELTLELSLGNARDEPGVPVVANAHRVGRKGTTALAVCTLTADAETVGYGTVRSYFVSAKQVRANEPDALPPDPETPMAELMSVRVGAVDEGVRVLMQEPNPALNNPVGAIHGGVASAGLEFAASAAMNTGGHHMQTASLRVNFLRPFLASDQSRYVATPLRIGRTSAVADAQAINKDGKVAVVARATAYR